MLISRTSTARERAEEMLARGVRRIHVAVNGVWSAELENGSRCFSYEMLDYHRDCREFLTYLFESGVPFTVHGTIGTEFSRPVGE